MTNLLLSLFFAVFLNGATLDLHLTSGGASTVARVYLTNSKGDPVPVPGAVSYVRRTETHAVVDGAIQIELPEGVYQLRAEKGHEYGVALQEVRLVAGKPSRITLDIPRLHDMNARGWYSGDLHTHRSAEEMTLLARAEGLNVAPDITRHVGDTRPAATPFPTNHVVSIDATHLVTLQNQEVERLAGGHGAVLLLNLPEPVEKPVGPLHPLDIEYSRRARQLGAFVDGEKPIWRNMPVLIALGAVDSIGIVNNHFHPNGMLLDAERYGSMEREKPVYHTIAGFADWMMDLYYSFLNCGFRIPVSAGSASGVMPSWPGYERVYVTMDGPFTLEKWFRSLKAGQSIATNGPLLEVSVNGKPPGAEFPFDGPRTARVQIDIHSRNVVDRVDVVFNGAVLQTIPINRASWSRTLTVRIPGPGWLVVRCFEPVTNTIRYAHTSPFYFLKDGRLPVKVEDARRWERYIGGLSAAATADRFPSPEARQQALKTFDEAIQVYRRLAEK